MNVLVAFVYSFYFVLFILVFIGSVRLRSFLDLIQNFSGEHTGSEPK